MNFLTPKEQQIKADNERQSLRGYWPHHPFIFMRRWQRFKDSISDWFKKRHCAKHGHQPSVVVFVDGLPYPPNNRWSIDGAYAGGGRSYMHAFCRHCWDEYEMFLPCYLPNLTGYQDAVRTYVNGAFPTALFIDVSDYKRRDIREQAEAECERVKSIVREKK